MKTAEDRHIDKTPDYVLTFRKACELIEKYGMDTGEKFTYNQVTALMIEFAEEYAQSKQTLDREKVMELTKRYFSQAVLYLSDGYYDEFADKICSLALPQQPEVTEKGMATLQ